MPDDIHDILIAGAGPAGSATAICAAQRGLRVLLIDREAFPRERACAGWIGPAGVALAEECGLTRKAAEAAELRGLTLWSWDLKKHATVSGDELRGWLVDRASFDQALLGVALKGGAEARFSSQIAAVELRDDRVVATLNDKSTVEARVLVVADGAQSTTARLANLPAPGTHGELPICLFVQATTDEPADRLDVVLGAAREGRIVTRAQTGRQVRLSLITRSNVETARSELASVCAAARDAGLFPAAAEIRPVGRPSPAGVALDLESHVGKRTLLVGDAGGFVAAFSNEGIYPAMRSGCLAAETIAAALKASVFQDELANFSNVWRQALADHLRMPNTDLSLLLPLVFGNEQMSQRVARAFLLGQPF